jgi:hypothetical protein
MLARKAKLKNGKLAFKNLSPKVVPRKPLSTGLGRNGLMFAISTTQQIR